MAKEKKEGGKARRPTAEKRMLQNAKRRLQNKSFKNRVRTAIRTFHTSLEKGDEAARGTALNEVFSLMDKGAKRGVYKKNKASRTKSRLAIRLQKIQAA